MLILFLFLVEGHGLVVKRKKRPKDDFLIQEGRPLPEFGTCLHYKRSHRWLRYNIHVRPAPSCVCMLTVIYDCLV